MKIMKKTFTGMKFKLIASLVSICLIPLIIFGVIAYRQSTNIFKNNLSASGEESLKQIEEGTNNYFKALENPIKLLSSNVNFTDIDIDNSHDQYAMGLLKDCADIDKDIMSIYVGSEGGKFLTYPEEESDPSYNHKTRPWYKDAMAKNGEIIITEPYKDAINGKMIITVAKSIQKNGKNVGVIALDVTLDDLSTYFSSIKVGQSGIVYVTDAKGNMISHPTKEYIGTDIATKQSFWGQANSNKSGVANYEFQGEQKITIFRTNEKTGWKMFVAIDNDEITRDSNVLMKIMVMIILIVASIAILIAILISKGIIKNLNLLRSAFSKAAEGDFSHSLEVKSKDEFKHLGDDFNHMIDNVSILMKNVKDSSQIVLKTSSNLAAMAEETNASLGEVARAVDEIAQGATKQAQSALTGVTSMEDLSDRLNQVSNATLELAKVSDNTRELSLQGLEMVKTLTEKSTKTKEVSLEVAEIVVDVDKSMAEIDAISKAIGDITEQTNLLSLNASIEAARAGEAGRGFAVVADEIRKLADESQKSTEEIKKIVENIQKKSQVAVKAIEETKNVVIEQEMSVSETKKIFDNIIEYVVALTNKLGEIKNSTIDITNKKENVLGQIEEISSISEETASASEEVSASTQQINATTNEFTQYAEELQMIAQQLEEEIGKFKVKN